MKTAKLLVIALVLFLGSGVSTAQENTIKEDIMIAPNEIKWTPGPASLPPGAEMAVLEGDPNTSGMVTMRLKLPPNYRLMPHTHPEIERVTVVSGKLFFGMGESMDQQKAKKLPAGSFFAARPKTPMFGWTEDQETVLQLNVMGPWDVTYLNPQDDPRKKE
jgi:quercetin dioxygenase-like cupin family protein